MRLYLGCAIPPFHKQHLKVMGDPNEWIWVDLYIDHPQVKKWDATKLVEVVDNSVEHIYASHLLEHFPQVEIKNILKIWYKKLKKEGKLTINVPDLKWAAEQIIQYHNTGLLKGYYSRWDTEHGLMAILYGSQSHAGEYHKSGFIGRYLYKLLKEIGFKQVNVEETFDAHDMGVLITVATK